MRRHLTRIAVVFLACCAINLLAYPVRLHAQASIPPGSTSHIVSWTAPTLYADGTPLTEPVTYNLYQMISGSWVKVSANIAGLTTTVILTQGLQQFEVSAVTADGRESATSAVASITAVAPLPAAPTNVTIK
jgi:hypothetical protein